MAFRVRIVIEMNKVIADPNGIAKQTLEIIASHSSVETSEISRNTELDDIGIKSLKLTEIILDLEDLFGIDVDLNTVEAWDSLRTVGDVVDAMELLVAARNRLAR